MDTAILKVYRKFCVYKIVLSMKDKYIKEVACDMSYNNIT